MNIDSIEIQGIGPNMKEMQKIIREMDLEELKEIRTAVQEEMERRESEIREVRIKEAENYVGRYFRYGSRYIKTLNVFPYDPAVLKCAVIEKEDTWEPGIVETVTEIRITTENVQLLDHEGRVSNRYKEISSLEFDTAADSVTEIVKYQY